MRPRLAPLLAVTALLPGLAHAGGAADAFAGTADVLAPPLCLQRQFVVAGVERDGAWTFTATPVDTSPYNCVVDRTLVFQGPWDPAVGHTFYTGCLPSTPIFDHSLCLGALQGAGPQHTARIALCPRAPGSRCTEGTLALTMV